jgi:hypothetical protein
MNVSKFANLNMNMKTKIGLMGARGVFVLIGLAFSTSVLAAGDMAPPPFAVPGRASPAVFVDFKSAVYEIQFDIAQKSTHVRSQIVFHAAIAGMPVFDLTDSPSEILLDGQRVDETVVTPATDTRGVHVVLSDVAVGDHTLVITHDMGNGFNPPVYSTGSVRSGFFMNDDAGDYLQNYLPSTYEFAQYKMTFKLEFVGLAEAQSIFTNGLLSQQSATRWTIDFPDYFNCSAIYFHTVPTSAVITLPFTFDDGAGHTRSAVIYQQKSSNQLETFKATTLKTIADLTQRFGPFPHETLVIYNNPNGGGGMEYSGATVTDLWALPHELGHSYFGRGVMPANGNAGWIDEAMATLTEGPYQSDSSAIRTTNMASHSAYYTRNDDTGYVQGMNFLAHLGEEFHLVNPSLSMDGYLKHLVSTQVHRTITTELLEKDLEAYSGMSLTKEFSQFVYGREPLTGQITKSRPTSQRRSVHLKLTPEMLRRLN